MTPNGYRTGRRDPHITRRIELSDEAWDRLVPVIPPLPRRADGRGRPPVADRAILNGVLTILANGIGVERLPVELGYGSGMTCWRRLRRWHESGAWPTIADHLRELLPQNADIDLARVNRMFTACGTRRRTPERGA